VFFCASHSGSDIQDVNTAIAEGKNAVENNVATSQKGNKSSKFGEHAKNEKEIKAGKGKEVNKPLGLGSTGRNTPVNLNEKLALEQAISNPTAGRQLPVPMTDKRWTASDGWVKMSQNINGIEIHYVRNTKTGAIDDFKFK
jgi:hypothetical protein